MDIKIIGWESQGLRCPDVDINLGKHDNPSAVTLIQMPNGTGKTTTLRLISACLSGGALKWSPRQIAEFRRKNGSNDSGQFVLRLALGEMPITFELNFDFLNEECHFRTTIPESHGVQDGWEPPKSVKPYFNQSFMDLVVFDGELASKLLDPKQTRAEAAIDALCQLDFFPEMSRAAEFLWSQAKDEGALTDAKIKAMREKVERMRAERGEYRKKISDAQEKLEEKAARCKLLEENKRTELQNFQALKEAYDRLTNKEALAKSEMEASARDLAAFLINPVRSLPSVSASLSQFKESLDKVRLPESSSRQFFEEIVEEDQCICGTPFNEKMRTHVREKMGEYLSSDTTAVLNVVKEQITSSAAVGDEDADLRTKLQVLKRKYNEYYQAVQERQNLNATYEGPGKKEIGEIEREIGELSLQISMYTKSIERYSAKEGELEKGIDAYDEKLAEALEAKKLKSQIDVLKRINSDIVDFVRSKVKTDLLKESNKLLPEVLVDNPVTLSGINGAIEIESQSSASVGQTLAVGYVFLAKLFDKSAHRFPFVVDSPVGALDNSVREQIGKLIPRLGRQFVAFTISSERVGFVNGLESVAGVEPVFLTVHRSSHDPDVASVEKGRGAFFDFHADKE